ncbi:MAG: hypothetical protein ABWX74_11465 [Aeromicrobium sp.]
MTTPTESPEPRTRSTIRLRLGSRISVLVALLLLVAAAYFYWTPLSAPTANGPMFDCQSAFDPPSADFNQNACSNINEIYQFRAGAALAAALILALVGTLLFGVTRVERAARSADPIDDDLDNDLDRPASS